MQQIFIAGLCHIWKSSVLGLFRNFPFRVNSCQTFHCRFNKMSSDQTCNSSSWTKEEDRAFETALAIYSGDSNQLMKIAAVVPQKSLREIIQHYKDLVDDVNDIEAGKVPIPEYTRMQSGSSHRSRLSGAEAARRKGVAWTAEEHRLFLQGLEKYGRGDWRSISRNCVVSRTPTQVASHAQKFFSRLNDVNKGKRRRSIHDITTVDTDTIGPSQGQKSDKLIGSYGGQLQWPITDYVTEAFGTGMLSLPGPVTNCSIGKIEGPSAVNPEKFPFGAAAVSGLNSSLPDVDDEFVLGVDDLITVPADGTSEARCGGDTRTSPLLSLQPSIAGGTGLYTCPVNSVGNQLGQVFTKQMVGAAELGPVVDTARLPWPNADHLGVHGCPASSIGAKNGFGSTVGAPEGAFSVDSIAFPSIPGNIHGVYPGLNATIKEAPEGGFLIDPKTLPSIPGTSRGVYTSLNSTIKDDNIFDLEDLFPDHIIKFHEKESIADSGKS